MFAHIFRRLIAITVIAAIAVLLSAPVGAAPEDGVARADSPTLSLRDLGSTPDLAFYGQNDVETVQHPGPAWSHPHVAECDGAAARLRAERHSHSAAG